MRTTRKLATLAGMVGLLAAGARPGAAACAVETTRWYDARSATCNGVGRTEQCQTARIFMLNRWRYGAAEYLVASNFTSLDLYRLNGAGQPVRTFDSGAFNPWGEVVPPSELHRLQWDAAMLDDHPYGIAMFAHLGWVAFEVSNPAAPSGFVVRNAYRGPENPVEQGKYAALFRASGHVYAIGPYLDGADSAVVVTTFDDPTDMQVVAPFVVGLNEFTRIEAVELGGHPYLFAKDSQDPNGVIFVYDLADPTNPTPLAGVWDDVPVLDWHVDAASGQLLVLKAGSQTARPRIRRYLVTDPTQITEAPGITLQDRPYTMLAGTGELVVAAQEISGGADAGAAPFMQAFSVAEPAGPVEMAQGQLEIGGFGSAEDDIGQPDGIQVVQLADGGYSIIRAAYAIGTATRIPATCLPG